MNTDVPDTSLDEAIHHLETSHTDHHVLPMLAAKHGTDKLTHRYMPIYSQILRPWRYEARRVLEIGVQEGNSLRMWQDYFTKAQIHGIDIHEHCKQCETDRIKVHVGEQQDISFLQRLSQQHGPFDIIIDDGSHDSSNQIDSFLYLFEHGLSADGLYVIEDLHDAAFYGRGPQGTVADQHHALRTLRGLVDHVNYIPEGWTPPQWHTDLVKAPSYLARNIVSITFFRFMCVIQKGNNEESSR